MSSNTFITSTGQRRKKVRLMFGSRLRRSQSMEQSELQQQQPQQSQQQQQPAQHQNEQESALHSTASLSHQDKVDSFPPTSQPIPWPSILNPANVKSGPFPFPDWIMNKPGTPATFLSLTSPLPIDTSTKRECNSIGEESGQANDTTHVLLTATTHERSSVQKKDTTPANDALSSPTTKAPTNTSSLEQLSEANEKQQCDNDSPSSTKGEQVLSSLVTYDRPSLDQSTEDNGGLGSGNYRCISVQKLDSLSPIATPDMTPTRNEPNNSYINISDDNEFYYLHSVGDNIWDMELDGLPTTSGPSSQAQKSHESASTSAPIDSNLSKGGKTYRAHSISATSSVMAATTTTPDIIVLDDDDDAYHDHQVPANSTPPVTPQPSETTPIPPPQTAATVTTTTTRTNDMDIDPTPAVIDKSPTLTAADKDVDLPPTPLPHSLSYISDITSRATDTIPDAELPRIAINEGHDGSAPIYIHPHFVRYLKKHQVSNLLPRTKSIWIMS